MKINHMLQGEVRKQYDIKISNLSAALDNCNDTEGKSGLGKH
jgi:hypothetical protein